MPTATENLIAQFKKTGPLSTGAIGDILATSPPTSADKVNSMENVQIPSVVPSRGNVSPAVASNAGIEEYLKFTQQNLKDQAANQLEREKLSQQQGEVKQSWLNTMLGAKPQAQTRTEALSDLGYGQQEFLASKKAKTVEIANLSNEYQASVDEMNRQIDSATYGEGKGLAATRLSAANIEREWAPKLNRLSRDINLKTAILNAEIGNFNEAYKFAEQAVDDETADLKFKADALSSFYDMNQKIIESMDSKYKDAVTLAINTAQQDYENRRNEANDSWNRKIDRIRYGTSDDSGGGTLEDGGLKFTTSQLNKGAVNAGLPITEFQGLNYDVKNYYINSSASEIKAINETVANIKTGKENPEDIKNEIDNSNAPDSVKEYLKSLIDKNTPAKEETSSWWEKVKSWFNKTS